MLKVFIDTNVWFSAFYSSQNAGKLIIAHINKKIKAVISQQVLDELVKNIKVKIPAALPHLENLLKAMPPEIIQNPTKISPLVKQNVHLKDQNIFQSVLNSKIKYFITGNLKHFPVKKINQLTGVKILNPVQALHIFPVQF